MKSNKFDIDSLFCLCIFAISRRTSIISAEEYRAKLPANLKRDMWSCLVRHRILADDKLAWFLELNGQDHCSQKDSSSVIDLTNCTNLISDLSLEILSKTYTQPVEKLLLDSCSYITDVGVRFLILKFSNLHTLSLNLCVRLTDETLEIISSVLSLQLKSLSLRGLNAISDGGLEKIFKRCTLLSQVDISQCKSITSSSFKHMAGNLSSTLIRLTMSWLSKENISESGLNQIKYLTKLEALAIADCSKLNDSQLRSILKANGSSLVELDLAWCVGITFQQEKLFKHLCNMQNLRILSLQGVQLSEECITKLAECFQHLEQLDMGWQNNLRVSLLKKWIDSNPQLSLLNLCYCKEITSEELVEIQNSRPLLKIFHCK